MACLHRNRRGQVLRATLLLLFVAVAHRMFVKTFSISVRSTLLTPSNNTDDGYFSCTDDEPKNPYSQRSATDDLTIVVVDDDETSAEAVVDGGANNDVVNQLPSEVTANEPPVNSDIKPPVKSDIKPPVNSDIVNDSHSVDANKDGPPKIAVPDGLPHDLERDYLPENVARTVSGDIGPPVNPADFKPSVNTDNVDTPVDTAKADTAVNPANVGPPVNPANVRRPVLKLADVKQPSVPDAYIPLTLPDVTPPPHPLYKVYPVNGTSPHVEISTQFDAKVFDSFCDTQPPLKAVLPIYSAVGLFDMRILLRNTLGRWAKKLNCRIFFIIGVSLNQTVNKLARDEYYREKDILMMDKLDTYRDLNDKAVLMFEWLAKHCMHVPYVIHLIDDAYINIEMWLQRVESLHSQGNDNFILGGLMDRMKAPRRQKLHTFVTMEEYPDERFPMYAIGFAYAWPANVSRALASAIYKARYCWIEDVWATGFLREAAGVELVPLKRSEWKANEDKPIPHLLDDLPPWFMIHTVEPELFPKLYSTVIN